MRFVPLHDTAPMPRSDQVNDAIDYNDKQMVEDQGGADYDQRNSDIRGGSGDDHPCADNVGNAKEKQCLCFTNCSSVNLDVDQAQSARSCLSV